MEEVLADFGLTMEDLQVKMVLNIEWFEEARVDVRRLDKPAEQHVLDSPFRFARTGQGDIKQ